MHRNIFPLHPSQEDIYLDQSINAESPHYNIGGYIKIKGSLNKEKFHEVVRSLPLVFDAYKMRFELNEPDPICYFDVHYAELDLPELDFTLYDDPAGMAESWMQNRFNTSFIIEKQYLLFEHCLIKTDTDEYSFFCRYHHLITDGYGFIVFVKYVAEKYRSLTSGNGLQFVYPSYLGQAIQGHEYRNSENYQLDGKYWLEKIPEKPQQFLQRKYGSAKDSGKKSATHVICLNREERAALDHLQQTTQSGLQQLTIAALLLYFGKTSNQVAFEFGIPVHKRGSKQLRTIMGMFSGILPYKAVFHKNMKLSEVLTDIAQSQRRDYRHHNYTIGDLSRALKLNAAEGYLCEVMVNYELLNFEPDFDDQIQATVIQLKSEYQRNPLQISWLDYGKHQPLELHIHFLNEYFSLEEIALLTRRIIYIFHQFSTGLDKSIGNFDVLPVEEKQLIDQFSHTLIPSPGGNKNIVSLFEDQVMKTPDKIAVVCDDLELSYDELNRRSNQLAHYLMSNGVREEVLVPLCLERSLEMIIAILGVLKAGGAYVPIDPEYPGERIGFMLNDTRAAWIICSNKTSSLLQKNPECATIVLNRENTAISRQSSDNPVITIKNDHLAYVIYTSGSTGVPKGVMIEHQGIVNLIEAQGRFFNICSDERILLFSNYCFDASVEQIFLALIHGASLILLKEGVQFDNNLFKKFLKESNITHLHATPLFLETLQSFESYALKRIIAGGDVCKKELSDFWKNRVDFYNEYGPTEVTVTAIEYQVTDIESEHVAAVPIGKPIAHLQAHILNMEGSVCPIGVEGEICLSGVQVARGYLNRPELTKEKFIQAPFSLEPEARMYKTGDIGRWLPNGNMEYLGRTDDQVKIRGYRIELGEIESALRESRLIEQAAVLAKKDKNGNNQLVGYIVPNKIFDKDAIQDFLRGKLPKYMVPEIWVKLEQLPLNSNGKIDRNALTDISLDKLTGSTYVSPGNATEAEVTRIWEELLDKEKVGIHDNFFELGGHSLKAIQLISRLQKRFHIKTDIKKIFANPTINELCRVLPFENRHAFSAIKQLPLQDHYELSHAQQRIWVLSHFKDGSNAYSIPKAYILEGNLQVPHLKKAFNTVIDRHEILRTVFIEVNGEARQKIIPASIIAFTMEEAAISDSSETESIIKNALEKESGRTFDLTKGPLFRVSLFRENDEKYVLLFNIHHIISDGWSKGILIEEIFTLYHTFCMGKESTLLPLPVQYKDYAVWQAAYSADQGLYWRWLYKDTIPVLNFPLDFERPKVITFKGAMLRATVSEALTRNLKNLAVQYKITLNNLLLSLYGLWVARYCKQDEVVIGSLTSGRSHADLENLVGIFINFLPVRLSMKGPLQLSEYLTSSHNALADAYCNQDYPFDLMVNDCIQQRDISHNPFFDTMVNFHWENDLAAGVQPTEDLLSATGVTLKPFQFSEADFFHSVLDFMLDVEPANGGLQCCLSYNSQLFLKSRMRSFLDEFVELLERVINEPDNFLERYFPATDLTDSILAAEPVDTHIMPSNFPVNICASFVTEPLMEYLEYWNKEFGLNMQVSFTPYNQVFQQLLNPDSMVNKSKGLNVLFIRIVDWLRDKTSLSTAEQVQFLDLTFLELIEAIGHSRKITPVPFLVGIVPVASDADLPIKVVDKIAEMNGTLESLLKDKQGFYLPDLKEIASLYSIKEIFDRKSDQLGHIPFTQEYYAALGTFLSRKIRAYKGKSYKVIAVDCDNTLWKGICGEAGAMGVTIDKDFSYLQKFLLEKHMEGFLLVLCSKNNEEDVWNVFNQHAAMVLKREHVAAFRINWSPKHENLTAIAAELNLALNSFIFLDDSSFEVEQLSTLCPEVMSLALPEDSSNFWGFLNHIWALDHFQITKEDLQRNTMYRAEKLRNEEKSKYFLLNDFLKSLNILINIRPVEKKDMQRSVQLSQRTNQFNLNGVRISEEGIAIALNQQDSLNWIIEVKDRFGDYGIVGLLLARRTVDTLLLESFLLSCRVLGRNVEDHVLSELQRYCVKHALNNIEALFQSTGKNAPFIDFLQRTNWKDNTATNTYTFVIEQTITNILVYK